MRDRIERGNVSDPWLERVAGIQMKDTKDENINVCVKEER
jgi:hypothetical protein